jgi:basic membrane lipoprotein Med (substrate-binding protein (PBP1-ABC) superfamily)
MKRTVVLVLAAALCLALGAPLFGAGGKEAAGPVSVGIFVPGVTAGSPLYEQMVSGAQQVAAANPKLTVKVVEGGFDQSKWGEQVMSMAATGEYTYIMTSNPSMPAVSADVSKAYPKQKFIFLDATYTGNPNFYTVMYNQVEQGYIAGYLAGLVTTSSMQGANPDLRVGAVVAQEYPALTLEMIPGYQQGCKAVNPGITLDYRVIGNWYDANKAADLTNSMIDAGVDVILAIAGGASQGIITAAQARGKYVLYFDSDQYQLAPGTIVGCAILRQEKLVTEVLDRALAGTLPWGKAEAVDAKAGYVDLADTNPLYTNSLPADLRAKMDVVVQKLRSGALSLPIPKM